MPRNRLRRFDLKNEDGLQTTVGMAKSVIGAFFKEQMFKGYTFIIPIGNHDHESVLFVRMREKQYEFLQYNCDISTRMSIVEELSSKFRHRHQAYKYCDGLHRRKNKKQGICGALSWLEIHLTIARNSNPFLRKMDKFSLRYVSN